MEKTAKYYLSFEGFTLLGILIAGLFDPSFWLWGVYYVGIATSSVGAIISLLWLLSRKKSNLSIDAPIIGLLTNIVITIFLVFFIYSVFSEGIHFLM